MYEHILAKIVFDRTCAVCNGFGQFKAKGKQVECTQCGGSGSTIGHSNVAFLVPEYVARKLPSGLVSTMKQQKIHLLANNELGYGLAIIVDKVRGLHFKKLYTLDVETDDVAFKYLRTRLLDRPAEIHMFFT